MKLAVKIAMLFIAVLNKPCKVTDVFVEIEPINAHSYGTKKAYYLLPGSMPFYGQ
jgi:hypothetical protein